MLGFQRGVSYDKKLIREQKKISKNSEFYFRKKFIEMHNRKILYYEGLDIAWSPC